MVNSKQEPKSIDISIIYLSLCMEAIMIDNCLHSEIRCLDASTANSICMDKKGLLLGQKSNLLSAQEMSVLEFLSLLTGKLDNLLS